MYSFPPLLSGPADHGVRRSGRLPPAGRLHCAERGRLEGQRVHPGRGGARRAKAAAEHERRRCQRNAPPRRVHREHRRKRRRELERRRRGCCPGPAAGDRVALRGDPGRGPAGARRLQHPAPEDDLRVLAIEEAASSSSRTS